MKGFHHTVHPCLQSANNMLGIGNPTENTSLSHYRSVDISKQMRGGNQDPGNQVELRI